MRNWDTRDESGTDRGCEWEKDWEDVRLVCRKVGIGCEMVSSVDQGAFRDLCPLDRPFEGVLDQGL